MLYIIRRDVRVDTSAANRWARRYWWAGDTDGWVDVRSWAFTYSTREKVRTAQEALQMLASVEETEGEIKVFHRK